MRGRDPCAQPHHLGGGFKNKSSQQHHHPIISVNALVGRKGGLDLHHHHHHKHGKKKGNGGVGGKSVAQKIIPLLRQINNTKTSAGDLEFTKSNKILKP